MYMHLSRLQKTLGLDSAFRYHRQVLLHLFPPSIPKFLPQSGFSEIPNVAWLLPFAASPPPSGPKRRSPSVSSWF